MSWETLSQSYPNVQWDYENAFVIKITVVSDDIDVMGHANNVVYLQWLEQAAWAHSESLGLNWAAYEEHKRAIVAIRHELDYLLSSFEGDELLVATWVSANDGRLRLSRAYQVIRPLDNVTVLRGATNWVCVDTETGRPKRLPESYVEAYKVNNVRTDAGRKAVKNRKIEK